MLPKKKRCTECRKKFWPDPRVGERQVACGKKDCQRKRLAKTQASWRSRNPSYQVSYRLMKRAATAAAAAKQVNGRAVEDPVDPPPPLRLPPALATFPWDLARAELGFAGADLLSFLTLLMVRLVREVKDEKLAERALPMQVYAPTGRDP